MRGADVFIGERGGNGRKEFFKPGVLMIAFEGSGKSLEKNARSGAFFIAWRSARAIDRQGKRGIEQRGQQRGRELLIDTRKSRRGGRERAHGLRRSQMLLHAALVSLDPVQFFLERLETRAPL